MPVNAAGLIKRLLVETIIEIYGLILSMRSSLFPFFYFLFLATSKEVMRDKQGGGVK